MKYIKYDLTSPDDENTIDLSNQSLSEIPKKILYSSKMIALNLAGNRITTISPTLFKCTNLKYLNLVGNEIHQLPIEIGQLFNLEALILSGNLLKKLPSEIGHLKKLERLELRNNRLESLPYEIYDLNNLKELDITGNPLPLPPEIMSIHDKPKQILNYYINHYLSTSTKLPLNEAKILLVGQGGVGKTSLAKRLSNPNSDSNFNPEESQTKGINITQMNISSGVDNIRLNVWDFGGQEIMHSTHQFFLTKRSLYILVLDSRQGENEGRIDYWLSIIRSFAGNSPVIVVCNKIDEQQLELDWKKYNVAYPSIVGFIKKMSCKTGEGINELIDLIKNTIAEMPHIHDLLLEDWFSVKTEIENYTQDYISFRDYRKTCIHFGVIDEVSQKTLLNFLHDLGTILHFADHPLLEDTYILNPDWVTGGVYQIINSNKLFQTKGILNLDELQEIFDYKKYPRDKHMFIVGMMKKFEICFEFDGYKGKQFLIPDLLPKEEPDTGNWSGSLGFRFQYSVLPSSIMSRFIVRMHSYISKKTYWRTGVVLISEDTKNTALVKADVSSKVIDIYVSGKKTSRAIFLAIIRADFIKIHLTMQGLNCEEMVPIPAHEEVSVPYKHLIKLKEMGEKSFVPTGLYEKIMVNDLLNGIEPTNSKDLKESSKLYERWVNPWLSGSFYISVFLVIFLSLLFASKMVAPPILIIILIGAITFTPLVSVFQTLNDKSISEKSFLKVIEESFKSLKLIWKRKSKEIGNTEVSE